MAEPAASVDTHVPRPEFPNGSYQCEVARLSQVSEPLRSKLIELLGDVVGPSDLRTSNYGHPAGLEVNLLSPTDSWLWVEGSAETLQALRADESASPSEVSCPTCPYREVISHEGGLIVRGRESPPRAVTDADLACGRAAREGAEVFFRYTNTGKQVVSLAEDSLRIVMTEHTKPERPVASALLAGLAASTQPNAWGVTYEVPFASVLAYEPRPRVAPPVVPEGADLTNYGAVSDVLDVMAQQPDAGTLAGLERRLALMASASLSRSDEVMLNSRRHPIWMRLGRYEEAASAEEPHVAWYDAQIRGPRVPGSNIIERNMVATRYFDALVRTERPLEPELLRFEVFEPADASRAAVDAQTFMRSSAWSFTVFRPSWEAGKAIAAAPLTYAAHTMRIPLAGIKAHGAIGLGTPLFHTALKCDQNPVNEDWVPYTSPSNEAWAVSHTYASGEAVEGARCELRLGDAHRGKFVGFKGVITDGYLVVNEAAATPELLSRFESAIAMFDAVRSAEGHRPRGRPPEGSIEAETLDTFCRPPEGICRMRQPTQSLLEALMSPE